MNSDRLLIFCSLSLGGMLSLGGFPVVAQQGNTNVCPTPALSRLKPHRTIVGETPGSIANQYNLLPETLIRLNPILKNTPLPAGLEILIPPFNGIKIEAPNGATWKDLEDAYGVRADILFEINGCAKVPKVVFIPGTSWTSNSQAIQKYIGLAGYPLPTLATVGLKYGWQDSPINQKRLFHSGIDLLAPVGTEVLAADKGIIAFVGLEGPYGILVIINHGNTYQTRYAHLSKVTVKVGQAINPGEVIGLVGTTGQPDIIEPHLHFEVRYKLPVGWVAQDPEIHLKVKPPAP
jgi:murein DD-endopeptidase MepM/ murein hydrolase activator NlpD